MQNIKFSVAKLLAATELHTLFNKCVENSFGGEGAIDKEFDHFCMSTPTNNTYNGIMINAMFSEDNDETEEEGEGLWDAGVEVEDGRLVIYGQQFSSGGGCSAKVYFNENGMVDYTITRGDRATEDHKIKLEEHIGSIFIQDFFVEPTTQESYDRIFEAFKAAIVTEDDEEEELVVSTPEDILTKYHEHRKMTQTLIDNYKSIEKEKGTNEANRYLLETARTTSTEGWIATGLVVNGF